MRRLLPFVVIDALLVIVFCLAGRRSHHEAVIGAGYFRTLWPFALGLVLGWAVAVSIFTRGQAGRDESDHQFGPVLAGFDPGGLWPTGVAIWLCTVLGGMALRLISGQGIAFTFVLVALSILALFLLGWRALWKGWQALRARSR